MAIYHHKESKEQIRCVAWFRREYPECARLLEHPRNEGTSNDRTDRQRQAIAKAEGVQAGAADLFFHFPSMCYVWKGEVQEEPFMFHSLAIEMKTKTGTQSKEQKVFQRYFEAGGGRYEIIRCEDDFRKVVNEYMSGVPSHIRAALKAVYDEIEAETLASARAELNRIISKA